MSINWEKVEKEVNTLAKNDLKKNKKGYVGNVSASYGLKKPPQKSNAKTQKTTTTGNAKSKVALPTRGGKNGNQKKRNGVNAKGSHKLPKSGKAAQDKVFRENPVAASLNSASESFINNVFLPANIASQVATGKQLVENENRKPATKAAKKGAKVGNFVGTSGAYLASSGGANKAITKGAEKMLATKAGKKATAKFVASKAGKKLGKEAAKDVVKGSTKSLIEDATIGTAMNYSQAKASGKEGKDLAKDMAIGSAIDLGLGGLAEVGAPLIGKALKNSKNTHVEARIVNGKVKNVRVKNTAKQAEKQATKQAVKEEVTPKIELPIKTAKQAENVKITSKAELPKSARQKQYVKDLQGTITGETPTGKIIKVMDTPEILKKHGAKADSLTITQDTVRKAMYPKGYQGLKQGHNLGFGGLEMLPKQLEDPIAVLDSSTQKDSKVIITNMLDEHNNPVIAALHLNKDGRIEYADEIASVYGKDGYERFIDNARKQGKVLYENKKIGLDAVPSVGLQLSGANHSSDPMNIIANNIDNVNKVAPPIRQAANEVKVTPSGKETKVGNFDVVGKSENLGIVNPDVKTIQEAMDSAEGKFRRLYKATVDSSNEINRLAKAAGDKRASNAVQAVRTSSGTAEYIYTKQLVNPKGEVIDNRSFYDVFKPVSKNSEDFNLYAQHLNNIDRWKQGKPVFEQYSSEESAKIVQEMLNKHPEFAEITENINSYWRQFTHSWLVETGRMSETAWDAMNKMYPNYVPAFRKNKAGGISVGGSHYSIGSGVKKAVGGHSETIPIEDAMMEQVSQMIKTTRKNDLYLSLIDTLKSNPEQLKTFGVVAETKPMKSLDIDNFLSEAEQGALKEINSKVYTISAMRNGEKVTAYINSDLAEALGKLDNVIGSKNIQAFANLGKTITNPMKAGITGYNPVFAISNMARDIPTALIQSEYGVGKTTKNMFNAIYQMATNGEMWRKYQALGGKSAGYIHANRGFDKTFNVSPNPVRRIWEGMKSVLGAAGEATESIPRLAEFISSMQTHGDLNRALNEAAEVTVNFSRAGEVTKALDAWTLYLNAAVQGIDKFARVAKAHPVRTAARSIGVVGVPYALLMAYNWDNPHYQDLNDRTKQNYFCIPNLAGEMDEQGYAKTFIRIPLNREYGSIFASSLDVVGGYLSGEANPWNGYGETLKNNFLPPNPLTDNVLAPLLINIPNNKDFAGRSIVPSTMENVSPQLQYDYSTSGLAKGIANVANNLNLPFDSLKSPMKVDYLIDSFGGYMGQMGQAATDPQLQGLGERIKGVTIDPFIDKFTADPRFSSGVVSDFYDKKDAAERAYNDVKLTTGEKGKEYIENKVYTQIQTELSDLSKKEREIQNSNLSIAEKTRQIKDIREQKNEIARSAAQKIKQANSEYSKNPTYETEMDKSQKESYEKKYKPLGISKEEYAKAKSLTKDYESSIAKAYALLDGKQSAKLAITMTSESAVEQATALKSQGVTLKEVERAKKILKDSGYSKSIGQAYALLDNEQSQNVATVLTSERAVQRATWLKQAGVTPDQLDQVASVIDANGNGSYSKDEIISFFNQNGGFSTAQKRAIFLALSTAKYSPY